MKRFAILIALVVIVTIGWIAGWFYIASRIESEVAVFAQADGQTQPRLECGTLAVGGFPFQFSPRCHDATITSGDFTITVPQLTATALFYQPTHLQLFATGPATVSDAFNGTVQELSWSQMRASVRAQGDRLARASLVADDLVFSDRLFGETILGSAGRGELHLLDNPEAADAENGTGALEVYVRLDDADIPGFDIAQGTVTLDGQVTGVPDIAMWGHPEIARIWAMAGGGLTLRGLQAQAQGLALDASGEAALDEAGRVNGTLTISSNGLVERFGALAQDPVGQVLIGSPGDDGTYSQSISARGGTIFVGIIPVQAIPPLF
jgi:hypothetical protein